MNGEAGSRRKNRKYLPIRLLCIIDRWKRPIIHDIDMEQCRALHPRSEGCVKFAKIRQLVSSLGQEASLCAIHGKVSITRDQVIVFQPRDDGGQKFNLTRRITVRFEIVDPDWLALGLRGDVVDGVLEVLLATRSGSPEPVNTQEANRTAGRVAQVEELGKPHHVGRVLEVAWSSQ